jgi:ribosomal protein L3 glutamine methyltransferase
LSRRKSVARWTAGDLIEEGARRFRRARLTYGHGTTNARDEAAWLSLHALKLPLDAPAAVLAKPVAPRSARGVLDLFERRIKSRKPAAYLTRTAWLGDLPFHVDERVIVPRSHIAGLLSNGLAPWVADTRGVGSILDLCTGSGCLAVLAARAFPRARVDAADISSAALAVARLNVRRYRLGRRVRLVRSDLYSALRGRAYDVIVCNPPYVTAKAMRRLPREYRREPRIALAGGKDGLDFARAILDRAADHLRPGGWLVMEVGSGRTRVERAFPQTAFTWAETPGGGDVLVLARDELPRCGDALVPARAELPR